MCRTPSFDKVATATIRRSWTYIPQDCVICIKNTIVVRLTSEDEVAEYMTEYDRDWYLGTDRDHDWQLSITNEKPFLFSLGRDKGKVGCF